MSWRVEMVEILRVLVDDMDETPKFSDHKLERVLVVAAFQVAREMTFSQTFAADAGDQDISPDPTEEATRDDSFVNLACLKAACIVDRGSAASSARKAFLVKDGGTTFDSREAAKHKIALLEKGWCAVYADAKLEYETGQVRVAGAAVMTPFRLYAWGGGGDPRGRQTIVY